jgi:hypothetical protein
MYEQLQTGGSASEMWAAVYAQEVQPSGDISAGDKLMVRITMGGLALSAAKIARAAGTDWYTSVVIPGYCDVCLEPIVGSDWWALPIPYNDQLVHIEHPAGAYWEPGCWDYTACPVGYGKTVAVVVAVENLSGCSVSFHSSETAGCPYTQLWGDKSGSYGEGDYYLYEVGQPFDWAEARDTLAPDSTIITDINAIPAVAERSAGFRLGYDCDGAVDIRVKYLVQRGTVTP